MFPVSRAFGTWFRWGMKKEAKGKSEQQKGQAARQIPVRAFSVQRWPVQMKSSATREHACLGFYSEFGKRPLPLYSRELDLGPLFMAVYHKLAA
jgi:hypothetical protein